VSKLVYLAAKPMSQEMIKTQNNILRVYYFIIGKL